MSTDRDEQLKRKELLECDLKELREQRKHYSDRIASIKNKLSQGIKVLPEEVSVGDNGSIEHFDALVFNESQMKLIDEQIDEAQKEIDLIWIPKDS